MISQDSSRVPAGLHKVVEYRARDIGQQGLGAVMREAARPICTLHQRAVNGSKS
jgi:hypothetical protein